MTIRYTVVGHIHNRFPMDMLRHSQSYPSTSIDATRISASIQQDEFLAQSFPTKEMEVELVSDLHEFAISRERWESFGWKIKSFSR